MGSGDLPEGESGVKIEEAGPPKEEEEPSWELPPELREFSGDPGDRRAAMAFTRAQNAARKVCLCVYFFSGFICRILDSETFCNRN